MMKTETTSRKSWRVWQCRPIGCSKRRNMCPGYTSRLGSWMKKQKTGNPLDPWSCLLCAPDKVMTESLEVAPET